MLLEGRGATHQTRPLGDQALGQLLNIRVRLIAQIGQSLPEQLLRNAHVGEVIEINFPVVGFLIVFPVTEGGARKCPLPQQVLGVAAADQAIGARAHPTGKLQVGVDGIAGLAGPSQGGLQTAQGQRGPLQNPVRHRNQPDDRIRGGKIGRGARSHHSP